MAYLKMCSIFLLLLFVLAATPQGKLHRKRSKSTTKAVPVASVPEDQKQGNKATARKAEMMKTLSEGIWGGPHIHLSVTESGALIEYDCAHGTIDRRIELDRDGRFEVSGTHEEEVGGPVLAVTATDENGTSRPGSTHDHSQAARYTGQVTAQKMTLTVTLTKTGRSIGTFTLQQGRISRLKKCL